MEKKTIILDLSCELIDKIDRLNTAGDRSSFSSHLLEEQLKTATANNMNASTELTTKMSESGEFFGVSGEINFINSSGVSLGKFDIDTLEDFENLTKKIEEISKDPAVQIRARTLF
jgi:hypothetical protein